MENFKITFLGTGNAIPTVERNHSSILVSFLNENILMDCGEGTQRQFRTAKLSPCKLSRILISHWHGDHILGIPGLLQTLAMSEYSKTLKIYGPVGTKRMFSAIEELMLGLKVNIEIFEVSSGIIVDEKDFIIETKEMKHGIPCNAYSIILKDKTRIDKKKLKKLKLPNSAILKDLIKGNDIIFQGKKIKSKDTVYIDKGKKISFIFDSSMNDNAVGISKEADLLVCESTFSLQEKELAKEYQHLTSEDAAKIAKKAKVKKLILTHISQRYEHNTKIIEKEAKKIFSKTFLAKDLDNFVV